ncbi:MAG: carboxypeptidase-like regulatory domain-containing protein [Nitrospirota bacterium]
MSRWVCVALASTWGWLAIGAPAWATHEVDHRFEVTGTVRAADGTPRPNLKVVVSHPRGNLSESALTDSSGRYAVLLHLHDKDAGDPVTVAAGDETTTIRADYDPKDHRTRRVVTVDFGPTVQGSDDQSRSMIWWYGAGGAALAGSVIYWRLRAKQSRRAAQTGRSARRKAKSHV